MFSKKGLKPNQPEIEKIIQTTKVGLNYQIPHHIKECVGER